jgi:hypothetical protein
MKKDFFDELLESVAEGGEILRGERQPSRAFRYDEPLSELIRINSPGCNTSRTFRKDGTRG